jgi:hypothetical protein
LSGTTLGPALWWSVAALVAVASNYALATTEISDAPLWSGQLGFAVASLTLCPTLAVLGAKRPQHHAWQWIVVSLWVIVNLPSAQSLLLGSATVELHGVWRWFLAILVTTGWLNWCGTRWWLPSTLVVVAEWCWLGDHLPWAPLMQWETDWAIGGPLVAIGAVLISFGWPRRRDDATGIDRVMHDFRDTLGNLWALRIAERFNIDARRDGWPVTLTRGGSLPAKERSTNVDLDEAPRRLLKSLVGRFVSDPWFERRWPSHRARTASVARSRT